jgi:hypothetical protein
MEVTKAITHWLTFFREPKCFYHDQGLEFRKDFEVLLFKKNINYISRKTYYPKN